MSIYELSLLIGALAVIFMAGNLPRARLWVVGMIASFVASDIYFRTGAPWPSFFAAICDGLLCISINAMRSERWERTVELMFIFSCGVNIAYHFASPTSPEAHVLYISILECINWGAMAVILGTSILDRAEAWNERTHWFARDNHAHRIAVALRAKRQDPPWHKVP